MILKQHITDYLLNPDKPHKLFTVNMSDKYIKSLNNINIHPKINKQFRYFGQVTEINVENIDLFLRSIGTNNENDLINLKKIIIKLTKQICGAYGRESCWLAIRVTTPTDAFDIPRWHVDGNFFTKVGDEIQSKFVMVLKGPGTLFCNPDKKTREEFFNAVLHTREIEERIKLQNILKKQKIIQLQNNQGAIFLVGDRKISAIHSEPPITEPRIFISILPGYDYQIDELKKMWNIK
jgi:hypothetical protein